MNGKGQQSTIVLFGISWISLLSEWIPWVSWQILWIVIFKQLISSLFSCAFGGFGGFRYLHRAAAVTSRLVSGR